MLRAFHWPKPVTWPRPTSGEGGGRSRPLVSTGPTHHTHLCRPGQGCSLGRDIPALMKGPELELCPISVMCKPISFQTAASVSPSIEN